MALTTIKTGGLADNSVTDAKVADAITVTGAQTGITQVGTLTAGTWNASVIASDKLDADTAHLSGTQTFSGAKTFTADIQITEAHPQIGFTDSDDNSDSRIYHSAGSLYIDADRNNEVGSSKVRFSVDDSEVLNITTSGATFAGNLTVNGTGSDIITGDYLYLDAADNSAAKNLVFRQLNDTWMGQIEFSPSGTSQIVTRVAQPLALGANNTQILKLRHETNQWGAEITSQSPYGLHVHTTGTSSGHDALKVSRHDDAIIFQVFADAATINKNALTVQGTGTSSFAGMVQAKKGFTAGQALDIEGNTFGRTNSSSVAFGYRQDGSGNLMLLENSTGADMVTITNAGNATFAGTTTAGGNVTGQMTSGSDRGYARLAVGTGWSMVELGEAGAEIWGFGPHAPGSYGITDECQLSYSNGSSWSSGLLKISRNGLVHNTTTFASGTNSYVLQASSSNANEFIVNGDDRYYMFNTWQTSWSDRKLKKNITSIDNGLDICDKLNPVTFNWKKEWTEGDAKLSTRKFHGIIAQELQEVVPELVYEGKDKLMVQRDELQWILLSAIKELSAKVTALENA